MSDVSGSGQEDDAHAISRDKEPCVHKVCAQAMEEG